MKFEILPTFSEFLIILMEEKLLKFISCKQRKSIKHKEGKTLLMRIKC